MSTIQSEIDKAASLNKWILAGYIFALLIAAAMTFFSWWAGNRVQDLVRKEADARISESNAEAKRAGESAAQANERAGLANERAQKLESDNIQLRTDLENATAAAQAKIEDARGEANVKFEQAKAEANAKASQLTTEQTRLAQEQRKTAEAQRAADEARLALQQYVEQVARRQEWRRFTPEARTAFVTALKTAPKLAVDILCGLDQESCAFAKEVGEALRAAGWEVRGGDGNEYAALDPFSGIRLIQAEKGAALPATKSLYDALVAAGFMPEAMLDATGDLPKERLRLIFGGKP
jgi:hypothetical protein